MSTPARQRGFTLLEILVVVIIVAVLAAMALPGFSGAGRWRDLNREAATLAARIRVAQDDAMLYGREYGIVFSDEGYRFVSWDPEQSRFRAATTAEAWPQRKMADGLGLTASSDRDDPILVMPEPGEKEGDDTDAAAETGKAAGKQEDPVYQPSVYVLSSGEVTPFTAVFRAEGEERTVELRIDALGNRVMDDDGDKDSGRHAAESAK